MQPWEKVWLILEMSMKLVMSTLSLLGQLLGDSRDEHFLIGCVATWYAGRKLWEEVRWRLSCMVFH